VASTRRLQATLRRHRLPSDAFVHAADIYELAGAVRILTPLQHATPPGSSTAPLTNSINSAAVLASLGETTALGEAFGSQRYSLDVATVIAHATPPLVPPPPLSPPLPQAPPSPPPLLIPPSPLPLLSSLPLSPPAASLPPIATPESIAQPPPTPSLRLPPDMPPDPAMPGQQQTTHLESGDLSAATIFAYMLLGFILTVLLICITCRMLFCHECRVYRQRGRVKLAQERPADEFGSLHGLTTTHQQW